MFLARYDGRCPGCDEPIYEGDRVGWVDGEVCCEDCVGEAGEDS